MASSAASRRALSAAVVTALLAGCPGGTPGGVDRPRAAASPRPVAVKPVASPAGAAKAPLSLAPLEGRLAGLVRAPAPLISDRGGSILSNNGGSVVSNNGGNVVSNNGGNLISDQGGSLVSGQDSAFISKSKIEFISKSKLVEQPYAGAVVRLFRASGAAVTGAGGQALTTTTDAQGRYAFTQALPPVPLLVSVELPHGKGTLRALAMPAAGDRRLVDADYISTLATGYIAEQYLKGLADPEPALAKLPPEVELETRLKTAEALVAGAEAGKVAPPETLTSGSVLAAVEALRRADAAIDAQMDKVRDILLAAGQADLGNGLPATEVVLSYAMRMTRAADGTLYIYSEGDYRVWRLGADGKLVTVLGTGGVTELDYGEDLVDGLPGPALELGNVLGMAVDARNRLIVAESSSGLGDDWTEADFGFTYRLDDRGRIEILWRLAPGETQLPRFVAAGEGEEVHVITAHREGATWPSEHWVIAADKTRRLVRTFDDEQSAIIVRTDQLGRDAKGRFLLAAWDQPVEFRQQHTRVYRYDPADGSFVLLADREADGLDGLTVAGDGTVITLDRERRLAAQPPEGERQVLLEALPTEFGIDLNAAIRDPDGTLHLVLDREPLRSGPATHRHLDFNHEDGLLYRIRAGVLTREAGTIGASAGGATEIALNSPSGLTVTADGRLFVADDASQRILEIGTDEVAKTLVGDGVAGYAGDGGAPAGGRIKNPSSLRIDGSGQLYWIESGARIRTVGADGLLATRYQARSSGIADLAVAPEGTLYLLERYWQDRAAHMMLKVLAPGETTARDLAQVDGIAAVALAPGGALYLASDWDRQMLGRLLRWTSAGGVEDLARSPRFAVGSDALVVDAAGRAILTNSDEELVFRFDPANGSYTDLAGATGRIFKGGTSDESVVEPIAPTFDRAGNLLFIEQDRRQIRRIPASLLE